MSAKVTSEEHGRRADLAFERVVGSSSNWEKQLGLLTAIFHALRALDTKGAQGEDRFVR